MKVKSRFLARLVVDMSHQLSSDEQQTLLDAALVYLERHGLSSEMRHFPRMLAEEWHKKEESIPVTLTTPSGRAGAHGERISVTIGDALEKKVSLTERADPSLLGGARLSYGDERLDFSLCSALEQFDA